MAIEINRIGMPKLAQTKIADTQLTRSHTTGSHAEMVTRSRNQVISAVIAVETNPIPEEKRPVPLIKPLAGAVERKTTLKQHVDPKEKGVAETNAGPQ